MLFHMTYLSNMMRKAPDFEWPILRFAVIHLQHKTSLKGHSSIRRLKKFEHNNCNDMISSNNSNIISISIIVAKKQPRLGQHSA